MRILADHSSSKQQAHIDIMTNLIEDAHNGFDVCSEKPPRYESSSASKANSYGGSISSSNSSTNKKTQRDTYVDMDKLMAAEEEEGGTKESGSKSLELSYERDSRWKPHLSWSFLSWNLKQRMEEQAAERELRWQRISDKLGPLLVPDRPLTFGQPSDLSTRSADERAYERLPIINSNNNLFANQKQQIKAKSRDQLNHYQSLMNDKSDKDQLEAGLRFMTVSGSLIFLILLLITIISLMASGVIPYSAKFQ